MSKGAVAGFETEDETAVPRVRVEVIRDLDALRTIEQEWRELRDKALDPSSFCSFDAIYVWWSIFGPELDKSFGSASLEVLIFRTQSGEMSAVLPAYRIARNLIKVMPALLISIGLWPEGSMETMCEEPPNLVLPGGIEDVVDSLGAYLHSQFRERRLDCVRIQWALEGFQKGDFKKRLDHRLADSSVSRLRNGNEVIYIDLAESWAAHRKVISKSMRDNLAYYPKLLKRHGHNWEIRVTTSRDEVVSAVDTLAKLHRDRSYHGTLRLHQAHIVGNVQERYLTDMLRELVPKGEGFIAELVINGKAVASQAFLLHEETLTVYYSGFKAEWAKFSPLFVLNAEIFESRLSEGVGVLNFLTVPGQWQRRWGPTREIHTFTTLVIATNSFSKLLSLIFLARRMAKYKLHERIQDLKSQRHDRLREKRFSRRTEATS